MISYKRLSLEEREKIYLLQKEHYSINAIALDLDRHKSTISRELKRGKDDKLGYLPDKSHDQYLAGLARKKELFLNYKLRDYVIKCLTENRWSPEQISGRLKQQKSTIKVSPETIYKFIYSTYGIKQNLPCHLKQRRKKRGFRKSRKVGASRIQGLVPIKDRPRNIDDRTEFGHWEGDLVIYGINGPSNISTLVERQTRYTKILANRSKRSDEVIGNIQSAFEAKSVALKSITFDRGMEFANHHKLGVKTYFCNPGSPWQKGAVENTNGRIRHLMPARTTPRIITHDLVDSVAKLLNNTPRKILNFKTPQELMDTALMHPS